MEGRLKLDTWEDKTSGQKRSKMKVVLENVQFLGARGEGGETQDAPESDSGPVKTFMKPQAQTSAPADESLDAPF